MAATSYYNPKTGTGWRKIQTGPNKGKYQAYKNFKPSNRIKSNLTIGSGVAKFISKTVKAGQKSISDSKERRQTLMIGKGTKKNPEFITNQRGIKKKNPKYTPPDTSTTASNTESTTKGDPFGREIAQIAQGGGKIVRVDSENNKQKRKTRYSGGNNGNDSQDVKEKTDGVPKSRPKEGSAGWSIQQKLKEGGWTQAELDKKTEASAAAKRRKQEIRAAREAERKKKKKEKERTGGE